MSKGQTSRLTEQHIAHGGASGIFSDASDVQGDLRMLRLWELFRTHGKSSVSTRATARGLICWENRRLV